MEAEETALSATKLFAGPQAKARQISFNEKRSMGVLKKFYHFL